MVTERELAEAHAFTRRRLVRAFVSGRDDEPPQPGRAVLAGLVLAGLLVAGAAGLARVGAAAEDADRPDPPVPVSVVPARPACLWAAVARGSRVAQAPSGAACERRTGPTEAREDR